MFRGLCRTAMRMAPRARNNSVFLSVGAVTSLGLAHGCVAALSDSAAAYKSIESARLDHRRQLYPALEPHKQVAPPTRNVY